MSLETKNISLVISWFCILTITLGLIVTSCKVESPDPLNHIDDQEVKRVLNKAYESAGGFDTYANMDSIIFNKKTVLYLADGSIESSVDQRHAYSLHPTPSGTISWSDSIGDRTIRFGPKGAFKTLNGKQVPDSEKSATSSFFSNYYVLFLPFKFVDPGVTLSYEGTTTIDKRKADIVKAVYAPEVYDNHSTSDEWWLFFDQEDGKVISNLVYHEPTYAYIENTESTEQYPLRMNLFRQTWRTDHDRNKEYLRGEFWYSNYKFTSILD